MPTVVSTPIYNLVKETSTTTGTGTITVAGAVTGYAAFSVVGTGNRCTICIRAVNGSGVPTGQWEICRSVYTLSGTTLTRGQLVGSSTGSRISFSAGTKEVFIVADAATVQPRTWDFVLDFDADPTYTNDNCAALQLAVNTITAQGGGTLYSPPGHYKFSAAPQNAGTDNAQVVLPQVNASGSQVSICIIGAVPAPSQFFFTGTNPPPSTGYTVWETTLTGQSGTASFIGGKANTNNPNNQNGLSIRFANLIIAMPANPTFTCIDISHQFGSVEMFQDVFIYAGTADITQVTEPTNANNYGIKMPGNNGSAQAWVNGLTIFGQHVGCLWGENIYSAGLEIWACFAAIETVFTYHPWCHFHIGIAWCPYGITGGSGGGGTTYGKIYMLDIEHANNQGQSWQNSIADIYDPANYLHLDIAAWLAVSSAVGNDHTLNLSSGCAHVTHTELV
jgi:hypothetical protein